MPNDTREEIFATFWRKALQPQQHEDQIEKIAAHQNPSSRFIERHLDYISGPRGDDVSHIHGASSNLNRIAGEGVEHQSGVLLSGALMFPSLPIHCDNTLVSSPAVPGITESFSKVQTGYLYFLYLKINLGNLFLN